MSNNNGDNDLDVEPFDDAGFDDYTKKGTLGDVWRNNPMVKIGVILAAVAVVLGGLMLFGGEKEDVARSSVSTASDVKEAPGSSEISSTMETSIQDKTTELVEEATRTGGSAMPIPTQPSKGVMPLPVEQSDEEDPLERWKRMQEERVRQQQMLEQAKPAPAAAAAQKTEPPVDTKTPVVNALAQSMATQMQALLQNQPISGPKHKNITDYGFIEEKQNKRLAAQQQMLTQAAYTPNGQNSINDQVEDILIPAGTIEYGQLVIEANTDAPGPVMANIISGPLRGSRVLGSFTSTDHYLVLNFTTIIIDGIDYPVQAVAIDPDTTLPGVITEINRRYFTRVILPMAAEFVKGFTEAISDSGTTSVYISDSSVTQSTSDKNSEQEVASGVSEAGEKLSELLTQEGDRTKAMLRVAAGTPIGILFVAPFVDTGLATR